ncbi:MAG: hypothetical protein M1113_00680 [Candidatus Thermoplasmatota archaeon]|nr:hypothetical protein [Candidatus Thermoplasmatota archaeon]
MVIAGSKLPEIIPTIDRELNRAFRAKRKFYDGFYAIYLSDQYSKDNVIRYLNSNFPDIDTIVTSGTIKKCKEVIGNREIRDKI